MNYRRARSSLVGVLIAAAVLVMVGGISAVLPLSAAEKKSTAAAKFDKDGNLIRPEGYREWVLVAASVTPNDLNQGGAVFPEFHSVYIDPASFKVYQKTGKFREGTVFAKELLSVGARKAPSGNGYFMGDFNHLEVAVKDSKRFPNEPAYWAYFDFTKTEASAKAKPTAACNVCHEQYAADDWVFTQYYPVLKAAKPKGK